MKTHHLLFFLVLYCLCTFKSNADEIYVFLTRDVPSTNLIQTWCGKLLSQEQFKAKMEQVGRNKDVNRYKLPVRFTPTTTFEDLFSTLETLHSAGLTNLSIQLVSNSVPRDQTIKRDIFLKIEDYSHEPIVIVPRRLLRDSVNRDSLTNSDQKEKKMTVDPDDLPVDNKGL